MENSDRSVDTGMRQTGQGIKTAGKATASTGRKAARGVRAAKAATASGATKTASLITLIMAHPFISICVVLILFSILYIVGIAPDSVTQKGTPKIIGDTHYAGRERSEDDDMDARGEYLEQLQKMLIDLADMRNTFYQKTLEEVTDHATSEIKAYARRYSSDSNSVKTDISLTLANIMKEEAAVEYLGIKDGLRGMGSSDIVAVASNEVGATSGQKYWNYVFPNIPYTNGNDTPWCACFVSWCANQAGYGTNVIPVSGGADIGVNLFRSQGNYHTRESGYIPVPGDIIYYDNFAHVGIVESCDGNYVHTIEGNTSFDGHSYTGGVCARKTKSINSSNIRGYGHPNYGSSGGSIKPASEAGNVLQTFDLSPATRTNLSTFTYENGRINWYPGTVQSKIFSGEYGPISVSSVSDDSVMFVTRDNQRDALIALGSYFGATGNRYRITFENGKSFTFTKGDAKADEHTTAESGHMVHYMDGSVMEFIVDQANLTGSPLITGKITSIEGQSIDTITKVELIEGTVSTNSSNSSLRISVNDLRLVAGLSVVMGNGELTNKQGRVVDITGNPVKRKYLLDDGTIDYKKLLDDFVEKYLDEKDGNYYEVEYAINAQTGTEIFVQRDTMQRPMLDENGMELKDLEGNTIMETYYVETPYLKPIIRDKGVDEFIEEAFEVKLTDRYPGYEFVKVTNGTMINQMIETLKNILFEGGITAGAISSAGNGSLGLPVAPDAGGTIIITSLFGNRPPEATNYVGSTDHGGIDIGKGSGVSIVASEEGTITHAGWNGGYGNCVIIDHGNGLTTLYGHMISQPPVSVGQRVSKGQNIGQVGSTGNSTGPHLHYEVRQNGVKVDPIPYLGLTYSRYLGGDNLEYKV